MNSLNLNLNFNLNTSTSTNLSSIFDAILPSLSIFSFSKPTNPAPTPRNHPNLNGNPFAFFTSGYMLGLLLLALVLHRIKHTVVPNSIHPTRTPNPNQNHTTATASHHRPPYARILPLDLAHTPTRLALHLPTLYLLSRSLALWSLIVLTAASVPVPSPLMAWLDRHETYQVCWTTFCAICGAFCVEAFIRALDGRGLHGPLMGMGASENMNTSPFNLVGYAILLHSYSSPIKHQTTSIPTSATPSRPDKHAAIIITIPLLQLTLLHLFSISKRHANHRLLPTTLSSILSLAHFHTTLLSYILSPAPRRPLAPTPTLRDDSQHGEVPQPIRVKHTSLPVLNYIPNTFETLLLLSIALSTALDRLARLLVYTDPAAFRPRPRRRQLPYSSPSSFPNQVNSRSNRLGFFDGLPYEEDFGVVLLRAGLRSLEGGGTRGRGGGWRNEVGGVYLGVREPERDWGHERERWSGSGQQLHSRQQQESYQPRGLLNEIRAPHNLSSTSPLNGPGPLGWAEEAFGARRMVLRVKMWMMFFVAVGKGAVRGVVWSWRVLRGGKDVRPRNGDDEGDDDNDEGQGEDWDEEVDEEEWKSEVLYQKFLRGEVEDDEEDGDYIDQDDNEGGSEDTEDVEDEVEDDRAWGGRKEALRLIGDLIFGTPGGRGSQAAEGEGVVVPRNGRRQGKEVREEGRLVLAQLLGQGQEQGQGVLTRRRWRSELDLPDQATSYRLNNRNRNRNPQPLNETQRINAWIEAQRAAGTIRLAQTLSLSPSPLEAELERDLCVVCLTEGREVICWPCRCLAMCEGCRGALAGQSSASTHRCPCCRRGVEGFSRIWVP